MSSVHQHALTIAVISNETVPLWLQQIYSSLLLQPVAKLYLHGPSFFGGWAGKAPETICAALTNVPEVFWKQNPTECFGLMGRDFYSWVTVLESLMYMFALFWFLQKVLSGLSRIPSFLYRVISWVGSYTTATKDPNTF